MRAYGSDRWRQEEDGALVLSCRIPKPGWSATKPRTYTSAEFPGTAVLWDEQHFEVVEAAQFDEGSVRYTLRPWREANAIRHVERYDPESEKLRLAEHRLALRRVSTRKRTNALGVFAGHLPAAVQEHLASEYGTLASKLTLLSFIPTLLLVIGLLAYVVDRVQSQLPLPIGVLALIVCILFESAFRFAVVWMQDRPIASSAGFASYLLWYLLNPRRGEMVSPFAEPKGSALFRTEAPRELAAMDAFSMREPLVTLLTAEEQNRIAQYFPYSYKRSSRTVALVLLVTTLLGVVSSLRILAVTPRLSAFVSLAAAGAIALEQMVRLAAFRHGPKGSVLAFLVRPFLRHFGV